MDAELSSLYPIRSISLPSRLEPNCLHFQEELNKLKSMHLIETALEAETIQAGFVRLAESFNSMAEFIRSPHTQQVLGQNRNASLIEEALEGSIGLLDTCGSTRDLISMIREHVRDIQSVLRRRPGRDSSIESKVYAYISFRKKAKNDISKYLRALKKMESTNVVGSFVPVQELDHHVMILESFLRELRAIAISTFRSLMTFLTETGVKTKSGGWSLVRKLMPKVVDSMVSEQILNEMANVDCALKRLQGRIKKNDDDAKVDVQIVQGRLERLDATMGGLEGVLDCIFRSLIQNRVALLNALTP